MPKLVYFPSNTESKGKMNRTALKEECFIDGGKFAVMFPYIQISCMRKCYISFGHQLVLITYHSATSI